MQKKLLVFFLSLLFVSAYEETQAQTMIKLTGEVKNQTNSAVVRNAMVYLQGYSDRDYTDSNGIFILSFPENRVIDGRVTLQIIKEEEYEGWTQKVEVRKEKNISLGTIYLSPLIRIRIKVIDRKNQSIEGANINVETSNGTVIVGRKTNEKGFAILDFLKEDTRKSGMVLKITKDNFKLFEDDILKIGECIPMIELNRTGRLYSVPMPTLLKKEELSPAIIKLENLPSSSKK